MICSNCGQSNPEGNSFCANCGATLNRVHANRDGFIQQPYQQVDSFGGGTRHPENPMGQQEPKKTKKTWLWGIAIILIIIACCCLATIGGGYFYLRNQGQTVQDLFSNELEELPVIPESSTNTPLPEETLENVPQIETVETQSDVPGDSILVVTSSGIWAVNDQTHETVQISFDQVDSSWDLNKGLSPDKKFFAFITGFGGASVNPMLVVLDIEKKAPIIQLDLTGPIIQPGMNDTHGDPAFEAFGAIQYTDSFSWSPDGTRLAFIAARDGDSADVYLFTTMDSSISRLSDEAGHATALHWSPDGQLLQYVSVNTFGTGAGFDMEGLWVYNFTGKEAQLLESLESNGEEFLAWEDNSRFWINSSSLTCGGAFNLRIVDAISSGQQVIVDQGFTAAAYDPENKFGMLSVAYEYDNCGSSEPLDEGLMIFGESVPVLGADGPVAGEIGFKKFEQMIAYGVGFIPAGNLFILYGDGGLQTIYYKGQYGYNSLEILPEVSGFVPYPALTGDFWAWASRNKTGLWVTENNSNPVELSASFSGVPLWDQDGQILYFFENKNLYSARAPQFTAESLVELPWEEILGVIK
jgi:hypothetical protein